MDALLTQRQIAQQIVDAGGDYVMVVKENQPRLLEDIRHYRV
jgi:predicted transposase YbfD/YdcC